MTTLLCGAIVVVVMMLVIYYLEWGVWQWNDINMSKKIGDDREEHYVKTEKLYGLVPLPPEYVCDTYKSLKFQAMYTLDSLT